MIGALVAVGCVLLTGGLAWAGWMTRQMLEQSRAIAAVQAQHVNNGGSTLRDAIDRIDGTVHALDDKLNDHLQQSAADSALLAAHLAQPH